MLLDDLLIKLRFIALAVMQVIVLVAGIRGCALRFGSWVGFLCPSIILCFVIGPTTQWNNLGSGEVAFLGLNLASALIALFLICTSGRPPALFWTVWIANSIS
jgi:hypothetical protein